MIEENMSIVRLTEIANFIDEEDADFLVEWAMTDLMILHPTIHKLFTYQIIDRKTKQRIWEEVQKMRSK